MTLMAILAVLVTVASAGAALVLLTSRKSNDPDHHTLSGIRASNVSAEGDARTAPATSATGGERSQSSATASVASSPSATEGHASADTLESYGGPGYTAEVPEGWGSIEDATQKQGYLESKWLSPANHDDFVLIDTSVQNDRSPAHLESPAQEAAPVHRALLKERGYEQIAYSTIELNGTPAQEWVFRIPGSERVDYFFQQCTSGFAVLGSTSPSRFAKLAPTFRAIAQSVEVSCE